MARLDPMIRSDTTIMLWHKARDAYELFTEEQSEDARVTLNKIVKCLAIMLDCTTQDIAQRIRRDNR